MLPDPIVAFLEAPNPAVMSVVRDGDQPVSVATWYLFLDGAILVNMLATRKRLRHIVTGSPVSLTVLADGDWYRHVSLQGRVREIVTDVGYRDANRLSMHYVGAPHTPRSGKRVSVWVDVTHYHAWRVEAPQA